MQSGCCEVKLVWALGIATSSTYSIRSFLVSSQHCYHPAFHHAWCSGGQHLIWMA